MDWDILDAQNLAAIDQTISPSELSPAQYEIVRRVIQATADVEYQSLVQFSDQALQSGAAALAARTPVIVDSAVIQVAILPSLHRSFANSVYCALTPSASMPQGQPDRREVTQTSLNATASIATASIATLAQRYPTGIFVVGQSCATLKVLLDAIEAQTIQPALVVGTPPGFVEAQAIKERLADCPVPSIRIQGCKGNATVAGAIVVGLIDLAWQAYGQGGIV